MSNAIALPMQDLQTMANALAASGMFGFKTPAQALAIMLVAQAQGIPAAQACVDFDLIQGKPAMTARAMLARFQQAGGTINWTEYSDEVCEAEFSHPQCPKPVKIRWTMDDARKAGLTGKDNWKKYQRQMLSSRVMSEGVDRCYPAASGGFYPPEVVQDFDKKPERDITPTSGAEDRVSADRFPLLDKVEAEVKEWLDKGSVADAVVVLDDNDFDADERVALWKRFDSKQRSAMKKEMAAQKAQRDAQDAGTGRFVPRIEAAPDPDQTQAIPGSPVISAAQHKRLEARIGEVGIDRNKVKKYCIKNWACLHLNELNQEQYNIIDQMLDDYVPPAAPTDGGLATMASDVPL